MACSENEMMREFGVIATAAGDDRARGGLAGRQRYPRASRFIEHVRRHAYAREACATVYERNQRLNYFNYFTEIEDTFVRRRGKHLFLSPMDWALMETWKQQGIPLHIVLRGIERSFDSFEAKPRKRTVKSLLYCQEEVEAQYAEWIEARVGASPVSDAVALIRSRHRFRSKLSANICNVVALTLSELRASATQHGRRSLRKHSRARSLCSARSKQDLASGAPLDTRKLEDSLDRTRKNVERLDARGR